MVDAQVDLTAEHCRQLVGIWYVNPVVEPATPAVPWWVPDLALFRVFERPARPEDPVFAEYWVLTPRGHAFRSWEAPIAFADFDRGPASEQEALAFAQTALFLEQVRDRRQVIFVGTGSLPNGVPASIAARVKPPVVHFGHGHYTATFHALLQQAAEPPRLLACRVLLTQGACKILEEKEIVE